MTRIWKLIRAWFRRFASFLRKSRHDAEFEAELESHLQLHVEDNLRAGMTVEAARRDALLKLGGVEQTKEKYRDQRDLPFLETLLSDFRFALRTLRKSHGFTAVAILTLTLGIGANTAIFAVVYGVLFRALPFPEPDRIFELAEMDQGQSGEMDLTATQLQRLREFGQVFEHVAGWTDAGFNLAVGNAAEHVRGTPVSADYFQVLGVHPAVGREFLPEEDRGGGQRVAILSHALWKRRFGAELSAIGRKILLNGEAYTVIGIMPAGFDPHSYSDINPGLPVDIWVPLALVAKTAGSGENIEVLARLKPGVKQSQLDAQMSLVTKQFRKEFPGDVGPKTRMSFRSYQFMLAADLRPFLVLLFGSMGFVLLIACANVANLLLARGGSRAREIAARMALGATRGRLSRQLLTESLIIALAGGALGFAFANAGLGSLLAMAPFDLPRLNDIHLDCWVFVFTFLISVLTGSLSGLAPAIWATNIDLNEILKAADGRATTGADRAKLRQGLVIGEFALSLVLLTGAGLMIATFIKLMRTGPGFDPNGVLTMQFWLNGSKYHSTQEVTSFYRAVESRIASMHSLDRPALPPAFIPATQAPYEGSKIWEDWFPRTVVLRSSVDPLSLGRAVRQAVETVDALVPTGAVRSMDQILSRSLALRSFLMRLLGIFGGLAMVLASVGLYGVISFAVARRTWEIGVRIALGARPTDVFRLILAEGLRLLFGGVLIGVLAALVLTRLLESMVYAVNPRDPLIFVLVSLLMIVVSLLACYVPARRATRVDPVIALRYESSAPFRF